MPQSSFKFASIFATFILASLSFTTFADLLVEKQRFETDNFKTFNGQTIKKVAVGWESYGKLNAAKDNVILITHFFSGSSHAAGKYSPNDQQAGYWDAIIGPDKAIDTNKYFVISVDTLVNLRAKDPNVITTGPASIDPDTGKAYGLSFPVVTIRDFVNVQKLVLESLGIQKLHAVIGPSMGSMQAIDWASAYPEWVPRMISVIGTAQSDPWSAALLEQWTVPIKLDPNWRGGDYYQHTPPTQGLIAALMFISQSALTPEFINQVGQSDEVKHQSLESGPLHSINQSHSIIKWLRERAASRAAISDANHLLYLVRANQLFVTGHGDTLKSGLAKIQAKTLFLPSSNDLLLMPYLSQQANQALLDKGKHSQLETLSGNAGHLNGVIAISQKAKKIRDFLNK